MSLIVEKQGELKGKVMSVPATWVTLNEAGTLLNFEGPIPELGTFVGTRTFGPGVENARETGPLQEQGPFFELDGGAVYYQTMGAWRKVGARLRETKMINLGSDGAQVFTVGEFDLATRVLTGTFYALT